MTFFGRRANAGCEVGRVSRKELDGLESVPGSFFCGTVVPALQLPTRDTMLGDEGRLQQWP
jgi:hypothetical protein